MEKKELRKIYLNKRRKLTKKSVHEKSLCIQHIFLNSELYKNSKNICCYMDYNNEVKTEYIIKKALEDGKNVYVPKILQNIEMEFVLIDSNSEFSENKFKIKEPKSNVKKFQTLNFPSVFLVPGIVFSSSKYRIGYGGGYYDRWIKNNSKNMYIGLAYEVQIIEDFEKNEYDQKMDYIITEKGYK